jgi:hypothetical protein
VPPRQSAELRIMQAQLSVVEPPAAAYPAGTGV